MVSGDINRKVSVILAADVVGYSKHMEKNEDETVKSLRRCETILRNLLKNTKEIYSIRVATLF